MEFYYTNSYFGKLNEDGTEILAPWRKEEDKGLCVNGKDAAIESAKKRMRDNPEIAAIEVCGTDGRATMVTRKQI